MCIRDRIREDEIREFFLLENDIVNLRIALKSKAGGVERKRIAKSPEALVSFDRIRHRIEEEKYFLLPPVFSECCRAIMRLEKPTPESIDRKIDELFWGWAFNVSSGFASFHSYVKLRIDLINIKRLIEHRFLEGKDLFLRGGNIDIRVFADALVQSVNLKEYFRKINFFNYFSIHNEYDFTPAGIGGLDKFIDDSLTAFWKRVKYEPFGFHTVCGYAHAKATELKNVNFLIAGKKSLISADELKANLRMTY